MEALDSCSRFLSVIRLTDMEDADKDLNESPLISQSDSMKRYIDDYIHQVVNSNRWDVFESQKIKTGNKRGTVWKSN